VTATAVSAGRDRRILTTATVATTGAVLPVFLTGAVGVQLRADLDFGEIGLGLIFASYFAAAALGSFSLGHLSQRTGPVAALRVGLVLSAIVSLSVAAFARSLVWLTVLIAVAGLANAITQPATNLLLADRLPARRLGWAVGLKQSGMPLASMLAGLSVPALATTVGWEWAYVVGALLSVLALAMTVGSASAEPSDTPRRPDGPPASPDTPRRVLWFLALGMVFGAAAASGLGSFLVSAAEDAGVAPGAAGLLLSAGSLIGVVVRLVMGARAGLHPERTLRTVAIMLTLGAAAFGLLAVHRAWVIIAVTPLAFGAGWAWPGLFNFAIVRANRRGAGAATGITQTGTYLGALGGPLLFGVMVDQWSYTAAWSASAVLAVAAAAVFSVGDRRLRHS